MMRINLQSIFLFFGITTFLLLGIGILQWHKNLRKLSKERVPLLLSHPLPGMLTCQNFTKPILIYSIKIIYTDK